MFLADAEMMSASEPAEVPVICHEAVAVPVANVPTLKVGLLTVKWLLCELSVNETSVSWVYLATLFMFCITTVTDCVWPTCRVVGIWFWLLPSTMSNC